MRPHDLGQCHRDIEAFLIRVCAAGVVPLSVGAATGEEVAQVLERCHGHRRGAVANELAQLWEAAREFGAAASYYGLAARQASQM